MLHDYFSSANIGVTQTFNQDLYLKPNKVYLKTYHHTNFQENWWSDKKVLLHTRYQTDGQTDRQTINRVRAGIRRTQNFPTFRAAAPLKVNQT